MDNLGRDVQLMLRIVIVLALVGGLVLGGVLVWLARRLGVG